MNIIVPESDVVVDVIDVDEVVDVVHFNLHSRFGVFVQHSKVFEP